MIRSSCPVKANAAECSLARASAGVVITAVDAFLFLMLERVGIRNLEALFGLLIGVMAASFGYMYADAGVDVADVTRGLLVRLRNMIKLSPTLNPPSRPHSVTNQEV